MKKKMKKRIEKPMKTEMQTTIENFIKRKISFTKEIKDDDDDFYGYISFPNKNSVNRFYDRLRPKANERNFWFDPYNWAAYAKFELNEYLITINSPQANNGDNNWYSYNDNFGFFTRIYITKQ